MKSTAAPLKSVGVEQSEKVWRPPRTWLLGGGCGLLQGSIATCLKVYCLFLQFVEALAACVGILLCQRDVTDHKDQKKGVYA